MQNWQLTHRENGIADVTAWHTGVAPTASHEAIEILWCAIESAVGGCVPLLDPCVEITIGEPVCSDEISSVRCSHVV